MRDLSKDVIILSDNYEQFVYYKNELINKGYIIFDVLVFDKHNYEEFPNIIVLGNNLILNKPNNVFCYCVKNISDFNKDIFIKTKEEFDNFDWSLIDRYRKDKYYYITMDGYKNIAYYCNDGWLVNGVAIIPDTIYPYSIEMPDSLKFIKYVAE